MVKKDYNPIPVYNRKLLRNIIRERAIELNGYHHLSAMVRMGFEELKEKAKENK